MGCFLRREGLAKRNMAIILALSLLIIITFPITVVRLGILCSFLSYIVVIVVITRYLLVNEGDFAPQSKGRLVTGPELEKLMESIETKLDSDLSGMRVEAFEYLEGDSVPTGLIDHKSESTAVIDLPQEVKLAEELKEMNEGLPEEELAEEEPAVIEVEEKLDIQEEYSKDLLEEIAEEDEEEIAGEKETSEDREKTLEEKVTKALGSEVAGAIVTTEEAGEEMTTEQLEEGSGELAVMRADAEEESEAITYSVTGDESRPPQEAEIGAMVAAMAAEAIEDEILLQEEIAPEEIEIMTEPELGIIAGEEIDLPAESLPTEEIDKEGEERVVEAEERVEAKLEFDEEYSHEVAEEYTEEITEELAEEISPEPTEILEEKAREEFAEALEDILDGDLSGIIEAVVGEERLEEEEHSISDNINDRIFDLIDQGFSHKETENLLEAAACFEEAWDLSIDDELKRVLSIELLYIYQVMEEKPL
ncbi:MAG: hypothetical protein PHP87_03575 [Syntrophomonas sp.]|uniref:hypothetical protein n=1 Tax=Syntrophomonas sp. TaxID=2053627 RepID=UPI00261BC220|nr:hypothetical protein [Syntrophomonas sp.]MDD4626157.1 hypothetical protein [Syntrophomonas sp.]